MKEFIRKIRVYLIRLLTGYKPLLTAKGQTLIIAPHPDDEIIGCAGLIQQLIAQSQTPHIVFMTGGEGSHKGCCDIDAETLSKNRRGLARNINSSLGVKEENLHFLNYPDGGIKEEHKETDTLKSLIETIRPATIFVPHWGEGWPDHLNTRLIGKELAKTCGADVYEYCVWMWYYNTWHLNWKQGFIINMTEQEHKNKIKAIEDYTLPTAPCGKPWSGVLPKVFLKAAKWKKELYFKTR